MCVYVDLGMEYCMCMTVTVVVSFLYTLNVFMLTRECNAACCVEYHSYCGGGFSVYNECVFMLTRECCMLCCV